MTVPMSDRGANVTGVQDPEAENDARLCGLMAALALPPVRGRDGVARRVPVEVEVAPGAWARVESMLIDSDGMTMSFGANGHRTDYRFVGTACPPWRILRGAA